MKDLEARIRLGDFEAQGFYLDNKTIDGAVHLLLHAHLSQTLRYACEGVPQENTLRSDCEDTTGDPVCCNCLRIAQGVLAMMGEIDPPM